MENLGTWTDAKKAIKIIGDKAGESFAELANILSGQTVLSLSRITEDDMDSARQGLIYRRFKTMLETELEASEHKLIVAENLPTSKLTLGEFNAVRSFRLDPVFLDISRMLLTDVTDIILGTPEGSVIDASFNNIRSLSEKVLRHVRFIVVIGNDIDLDTIDPKLINRIIFMPECYFMTMPTKYPECRPAHAIYYAYRRSMLKLQK